MDLFEELLPKGGRFFAPVISGRHRIFGAAFWAATCGISQGAYLVEAELFIESMPHPVVQNAIALAKYAMSVLQNDPLALAGGHYALAYFILHPMCVDAEQSYSKDCKTAFDNLSCTVAKTQVLTACGTALATYIYSGKLFFCDYMFPNVCVLTNFVGK